MLPTYKDLKESNRWQDIQPVKFILVPNEERVHDSIFGTQRYLPAGSYEARKATKLSGRIYLNADSIGLRLEWCRVVGEFLNEEDA